MKSYFIVFIAFIFLFTGFYAYAEEKKWGNQTELSYVDTGGNTDVTTLSAKNIMSYNFSKRLATVWEAGALSGKSDGVRNSERYYSELRGNYLFTERFYSILIAGWVKDQFAGIDPRYYIGPGLGYKILKGPGHFLISEAGVDYVNEEYTDNTDDDYMRGRVFAKYDFLFTEKTRFMQSGEYLHDFDNSDNYNIISLTSITSSLSDSLSLKTSYEIRYDNEPVPEVLDDTDTVLTIALVINF